MQPDKIQRQIELEYEGIQAGIDDYRKKVQSGSLAELPPGVALMKHNMEPLVEAIEQFKRPARGASAMQAVRHYLNKIKVTSEELAYLTLRVCLHAGGSGKAAALQRSCISLTEMIMDQHEFAKFRQAHTGYVKRTLDDLRMATQRHKRTVLMLKKREKGLADDMVDQQEKLIIGAKLIDLCILSTGVVEKVQIQSTSKDGFYTLVLSEKAQKWVESVHDKCELLSPTNLPTIIPPQKWEGITGGGYYGNAVSLKYKLVKTQNKTALNTLGTHEMPEVYEALNTIQETPWRINQRVYDVMKELWENGSTLAGLPERDRKELPPKPWSSDEEYKRMKEEDPERVTAWKRAAAEVYEEFVRNKSKRTAMSMKLRTAGRFIGEEEIFFPHVLDWRGRVYPIPNYVNPQGDDIGKGLLEFAKGKVIGTEGGPDWLKIHLANTYGVDKVSFKERIAWVQEHITEILDSAENPLDGSRFWMDADSPFCFLAACFEIKDYLQEGPTYITHLPIALDGTCSGLQHFSAMLKDAIGGAAVNLLPADTPQDIYARVAAKATEMVKADAANGVEEALVWLGKVDRGIAKRPVMTSPYGAKKYGFKEQLMAELQKRGSDYLGIKDNFKACCYLSEICWEAIGQIVVAARDAMNWLQEVAKVCSEAEIPVWWTTPIGFKAHQEYLKTTLKRVDTFWGGTYIRLSLAVDTDKMDTRKQANGIAPNFVHSMDAAHLMKTVLACKAKGITDFAMIHDSFGTHACDIDTLAATLRETFVEQYSVDVLTKFRDEVIAQLPEEFRECIPAVPPMGDLNLEDVKASLYFFA